VSIRKINKKRLSRKFRLKHAPLTVLPLTTPGGRRHRIPKDKNEQICKMQPSTTMVAPQRMSIQCSIEEVGSTALRHAKKLGWRKAPLTFHPFVSTRMKMKAFHWIFVCGLVVLAVGVLFILLQDGFTSMKNIVIYGAMGFFTFFMGYFGTLFARDIIDLIMEKKDSRNDVDLDA
jgi:hypothetical protein